MASRDIVQYRSPLRRALSVLTVLFLIVYTVWTVLPLFIMFVSSFKDLLEAFQLPAVGDWAGIGIFFNFTPTVAHYVNLFENNNFGVYFLNSLVAALGSALVSVVLGASAAYALSRSEFRGKKDLLFWIISTRMAPVVAVLVPLYAIFRSAGLIGTLPGLVLAYTTFNLPFAIWIMRDFFAGLPRELEEASLTEGATWWTTFWRISLPLAIPGLAATGILLFIFSWNEYLFASLLAFEKAKTMPVTLAGMATAIGIRWWLMSALAIVSMVPTTLLGLLLQRYIVRGLTAGALK